ncbi:MAG TPA: serine hydrolase domain-containing protein [Steroidobacteraceae bacterium]|jgi:CubicO group peptidase (beta-lactamase class C family)|nr:serine hydrolase domain-containing protein [Steroidobacteraceae bacterium]
MYRTFARAVSVLLCAGAFGAAAAEPGTEAAPAARTSTPPPAFAAAVDAYLREEMRRQHIPGISLAIAKDGMPLYVRGYGAATLEHDVPAEPRTVWQIGSIGKQFTAVAVMKLADEHRLNLDDPLSKYLPEVPPSWGRVTLRLMLAHQSGIPQLTTPQRQLLELTRDYTDLELIKLAASQPLDFEPGTDVSYSDTGYVLLGFVINRVAGRFYGDFLQQRVFAPLGMDRTRIISDADIVPDRASGYELTEAGTVRNQAYVSPALNRTADGSLYSTVLDLMKWDRALYGDAVLPHAELERMWRIDAHADGRRPFYHYGYGWENNRLRGQRIIEYDGNWQGFQAVMSRYVDKRLTVILLTNLSLCRTERMGHAVAGFVDPDLRPYPKSIPDTAPARTSAFKAFLQGPRAADEEAAARGGEGATRRLAALTPAARARLSAALHTLRRDLQERGPILDFTVVDETGRARVYRAEEKDMVEFYTVRYAADGRIEDLDLLSEY